MPDLSDDARDEFLAWREDFLAWIDSLDEITLVETLVQFGKDAADGDAGSHMCLKLLYETRTLPNCNHVPVIPVCKNRSCIANGQQKWCPCPRHIQYCECLTIRDGPLMPPVAQGLVLIHMFPEDYAEPLPPTAIPDEIAADSSSAKVKVMADRAERPSERFRNEETGTFSQTPASALRLPGIDKHEIRPIISNWEEKEDRINRAGHRLANGADAKQSDLLLHGHIELPPQLEFLLNDPRTKWLKQHGHDLSFS